MHAWPALDDPLAPRLGRAGPRAAPGTAGPLPRAPARSRWRRAGRAPERPCSSAALTRRSSWPERREPRRLLPGNGEQSGLGDELGANVRPAGAERAPAAGLAAPP